MHRPDDYIGFIPSCPLHILQQNCALVWNYCRVWCGQVSQHQQRMFAHFARLSPCVKTRSVTLTNFFCGTNSHNQCYHCWGFFTRSGVFLFHLGFGVFKHQFLYIKMPVILSFFITRNLHSKCAAHTKSN